MLVLPFAVIWLMRVVTELGVLVSGRIAVLAQFELVRLFETLVLLYLHRRSCSSRGLSRL